MSAFHVPYSYHRLSNSKQHKLLLAVFHESGLAAQKTLYMNPDGGTCWLYDGMPYAAC